MRHPERFLLTCEHGGNRILRGYRGLFTGVSELIEGHQGYDIGALALARRLARELRAPLYAVTLTRLLVDANRSAGHRQLFSPWTRALPTHERRRIVQLHHSPHWERVEAFIRREITRGNRVVHISVHSFAPFLDGKQRDADIGLLYDAARDRERDFCWRWKRALRENAPGLRVRCNYPYRGKSDGLTSSLREIFSTRVYRGIELEVNQTHMAVQTGPSLQVSRALTRTLMQLLT